MLILNICEGVVLVVRKLFFLLYINCGFWRNNSGFFYFYLNVCFNGRIKDKIWDIFRLK